VETVTFPFKHGPKKQLIVPKGDPWTGRSVELYGEYSENEVDVFREFIRPDDICIDAGALFGAHTLAMADLVSRGTGGIFAFEPQPLPFSILARNTSPPTCDVTTCQQALGRQDGFGYMNSSPNH